MLHYNQQLPAVLEKRCAGKGFLGKGFLMTWVLSRLQLVKLLTNEGTSGTFLF